MADVGPAPWRVASSAARAPGDRVGNTPSRSRGSGIERGGTRVDGLEVRRTTVRHRIEGINPREEGVFIEHAPARFRTARTGSRTGRQRYRRAHRGGSGPVSDGWVIRMRFPAQRPRVRSLLSRLLLSSVLGALLVPIS